METSMNSKISQMFSTDVAQSEERVRRALGETVVCSMKEEIAAILNSDDPTRDALTKIGEYMDTANDANVIGFVILLLCNPGSSDTLDNERMIYGDEWEKFVKTYQSAILAA